MKTLSTLIVLFACLMTSCSSQSKFNLADIALPINLDQLKNEKFQVKRDIIKLKNFTRYTSNDKNMFVFDEVKFKEEFSSQYHSPTDLEFYVNENSRLIQFIRLKTFDNKNGEQLYVSILKLYGVPDYYRKDKQFFYGVWEKENTTYMLEQNFTTKIGEEKTITSYLYILNNEIGPLVDYYYSSGFEYYKDFVKARKEKQNPNYTYPQFATDKKNEFFEDEQCLDALENNLPIQ